MRVDGEPASVVEAVGGEALGARPRVEVQVAAAQPVSLIDQPVEQGSGVTVAAGVGFGGEVLDVQVVPPGEAVGDAKARHRNGLLAVGEEGAEEPVAARAQYLVDVLGEAPLVLVGGAQRSHGPVRATRFPCRELSDLDHGEEQV
jgi:hypothetical protein